MSYRVEVVGMQFDAGVRAEGVATLDEAHGAAAAMRGLLDEAWKNHPTSYGQLRIGNVQIAASDGVLIHVWRAVANEGWAPA